MEKKDIREILEKVSSGHYSQEEEGIAKRWLFQLHRDEQANLSESRISAAKQKVWANLQRNNQPRRTKATRLWPRIGIAAAVATVILSAGIWFYQASQKQNPTETFVNDIAPGKLGATLTLANGTKIRLFDAGSGELAKQAGVTVTKLANGQLSYEIKPTGETATGTGAINTLATAKGETYQVRLPDGSQVWLNAASTLTYAANLKDLGERRVKLEGEAYFQVAKDKAHPFIVESSGQQVQVLGTHFNINAYGAGKAAKTTLLEGSVRVSNPVSKSFKVLVPGEQSSVIGNSISVANVETEDAVAWKEGMFSYVRVPLETIMDDVSRWYNVDIVYQDESLKGEEFFVSVTRFDQVSKLLKLLGKTGTVKFEIKGRQIIIGKTSN